MQQILFRQDSSRRESKIDNKVQVSVMRCEISKSTRVLYTSNKVPYLVVVVISTLPHLSLSRPISTRSHNRKKDVGILTTLPEAVDPSVKSRHSPLPVQAMRLSAVTVNC